MRQYILFRILEKKRVRVSQREKKKQQDQSNMKLKNILNSNNFFSKTLLAFLLKYQLA